MNTGNRVLQACNQCRSKKRRCDGTRPVCGLCSRLRIDCEYKSFDPRWTAHIQRKQPDSPSYTPDESSPAKRHASSDAFSPPTIQANRASALRANSGALSADLVRQDLGPNHGRSTHTSPWNLGIRTHQVSVCCKARPVYEVISLAEYDRLVPVYFQKIHVLQGSFSETIFNRKKRARFERKAQQTEQSPECLDLLFCAVGCLAALFSGGSPYEAALSECVALHLASHTFRDTITAYDVDGLLLRTLYYRLTTGIRAGWMSSSLTLTALQDSLIRTRTGAHDSGVRGAIYELDHQDVPEKPDLLHEKRSRLAKNMNDWISNEAGQPKAFPSSCPFRGVPISEMAVGPGWELLKLAEMSQQLDPDDYEMDTQGLGRLLHDLCSFKSSHDFVLISQVNLANMTFRRLRSLRAKLPAELAPELLASCCDGLEAAKRLAADGQPWHHVANVPFQVLCTFLLLDTGESLSKVSSALATIRYVCECFTTPTMQATVQTATHLVGLARQRKEQDCSSLSTGQPSAQMVNGGSFTRTPSIATDAGSFVGVNGYPNVLNDFHEVMPKTDLAPGLLEADFSSWDNIDWDQVLQTCAIIGPMYT